MPLFRRRFDRACKETLCDRRADGSPAETVLTAAELEAALARAVARAPTTDPQSLFRWVEAHRIQLAYAHDPLFAVSLSGVRGLPHQIEAVYRRPAPQPQLRFVLADDPGSSTCRRCCAPTTWRRCGGWGGLMSSTAS
jgi:hypothetical protein